MREKKKNPGDPQGAEQQQAFFATRVGRARPKRLPLLYRLPEGSREQTAPREKPEQENGDIKQKRAAVPLHGVRKSAGGIGLGSGNIVRAVDGEHGEVPGRGNEYAEGPAEQRPACREIACPLPGERQVRHDAQQGNDDAHRPFGQRAQRHAKIE